MDIRRYEQADFAACREIFLSNVPRFFMPEELYEFAQDLKRLSDPYFVAVKAGQVVGSGGYFRGAKGVGLSWGMVRRDLHGQGIGKALVQYRLERIAEDCPDQAVHIDTSQHTRPFYEKMGFIAERVEENGYGPGLHKVLMKRPPALP
ncbi:GNAT family N-acetyltransferase [Pseudovibrio sp. SCP19]|uniref:GNAT family N-acetyltransferase n=1 Tax=Pseudovibrio sp. SCP19 TaxID=3141374 RepID=UPI00333A8813